MASDESTEATRTLDAREIEGEPFGDIMGALESLPEDGTLRLLNNFEPEPLYGVLAERGFTHETEHVADDEWLVRISHAGGE
ncbi:DUF2249 domain-containing protein [Halosimplex amylolyticum]|uniref:DUF2249 domain-containing protein n=1 Tax=Halosimplex amylolyticum TaxID=3396616 RepID=UPI003F54CCE2